MTNQAEVPDAVPAPTQFRGIELYVLLHYYLYSPKNTALDDIANAQAVSNLISLKLLKEVAPHSYITTAKGNLHIQQLRRVPMPQQGWIAAYGLSTIRGINSND